MKKQKRFGDLGVPQGVGVPGFCGFLKENSEKLKGEDATILI